MIARDSKIGELAAGLLKCLNQLEWLPILLVRLSVGLLFFESGRGKLFVKLEDLADGVSKPVTVERATTTADCGTL
ncbi:MAG: hypothetical protein ACE10C_09505, partial [Candidatus Binatia bacterium]